MAKFHINREDGTVGPCGATVGKCPYGGDDAHYTSMAAAAAAYEGIMGAASPKPIKRADKLKDEVYGLTLKTGPIDYKIADDPNDGPKDVSVWDAPIYEGLRQSGHAITHNAASDLLYQFNQVPTADRADFGSYLKVNEDKDYATNMANFINVRGRPYTKAKGTQELNETLMKRTRDAIFANRPFGFPEDELSRSHMDRNESQLLRAASAMSGVPVREIEDKIRDNESIIRPLETADPDRLRERIRHIEGLTRPQQKHISEIAEAKRELAIREVLELRAKTSDDATFWREAINKLGAPGVNFRIVRQLVGPPSKSVLSKLTEDQQRVWSPRFGR